MRVSLLNALASGGAATATSRIAEGLRRIGVDAELLHRAKEDPGASRFDRWFSEVATRVDALPLKPYRPIEGSFSLNWAPDRILSRLRKIQPDVVHLNWISGSFINVKSISEIQAPVVWRLPDMWAMTGGCHYARECKRFQERCGKCPALDSSLGADPSRWTWNRKASAWESDDFTVVAPSSWLAAKAQESSLLSDHRIEVIPNGLDTDIFSPQARRSDDRHRDPKTRTILFGAPQATTDRRKGPDLLFEALDRLAEELDPQTIELVIFGADAPGTQEETPFQTTYSGFIEDETTLAGLYAAADVMVVPSRYEGFGQTNAEALACGTPVVAFNATGPKDIVDHKQTGYLAEPYDPSDLAEGIRWVLEDDQRREALSERARDRAAKRFSLDTVAHQCLDLYEDLVK
jgi:glycosyltransferase involved in cell wall biosynthesis